MAQSSGPLGDAASASDAAHSSAPQQTAATIHPLSAPESHAGSTTAGASPKSSFTQSSTQSPVSPVDRSSQHEQTMAVEHLSFFQRYFTKPIDKDPEKFSTSKTRRFSFPSIGFLFTLAILLVILLGVVAAAVAVTLKNRADRPHTHPNLGTPGPSTDATHGSVIRTALNDNFPDPSLWYANGTWYAYGTNNAAGILAQPQNSTSHTYGMSNVQLATSLDFINWTLLPFESNPLPTVAQWAPQGLSAGQPQISAANVWAPGIIQRGDGNFVMYYSATVANYTNPSPNHPPPHCIGAALSENMLPTGPFEPVNETLACPIDQGGAIDPSPFLDKDGTHYVTYKVDGNNIGNGGSCGNTVEPIQSTPIMLQKMQPDALTPDGEPIQIMDRTNDDGPLVEAPQIVRSHEGIYFLFFSSGCTRAPSYNVKVATAQNVTGPYSRAESPLLQTGDWDLEAPGSVGIHDDGNGGWNMAFQARVNATQGGIRAMFTTKLQFSGTNVTLIADNSTASS